MLLITFYIMLPFPLFSVSCRQYDAKPEKQLVLDFMPV